MNTFTSPVFGTPPRVDPAAISNHFPPHIRDALVAASQTWTDADPMARVKAINRAVERAQATHPDLFRNS